MKYKVKLTYNAINQLRGAVGYIFKVHREPDIAKHWSDRIKRAISSLG